MVPSNKLHEHDMLGLPRVAVDEACRTQEGKSEGGLMTECVPEKESPQYKNIPVSFGRDRNMAVHLTKASRPVVEALPRTRRQGSGALSNSGEMEAQVPTSQAPSSLQLVPQRTMISMQDTGKSRRKLREGGDRNISVTFSEGAGSLFSAQRLNVSPRSPRPSTSLPGQNTSPRSWDGYSSATNFASSIKSLTNTGRSPSRRPGERRSDAGSSVVSIKSTSSGSRASGESPFYVTGNTRISALTSPTNQKQEQGLSSTRSRPLLHAARRSSEPVVPSADTLKPKASCQQSTEQLTPRERNSRSNRNPRDNPAPLLSSQREISALVCPEQGSSRKTRSGEETQRTAEEEGDEDDVDDDSKGLDWKVLTWLEGLDSATCRRFMRKQMATLQDVEDS